MPTVTAAPLVFPPDKPSLCVALRAVRAAVVAEQGADLAAQLAQWAESFPRPHAGAVAAGYWPLPGELDPRLLMDRLWSCGWSLALPVVVASGRPLLFRRYNPGDVLESGAFGVSQPPATAETVFPDLVLTPLLGFNRTGHRLGYGGGFYDRTLADLRTRGPITAVGLALPQQECPDLPVDSTDQRLDFILTPSGLL